MSEADVMEKTEMTPEPDHRPLVLATVADIRPIVETDYPNFRELLANLLYEIEKQPYNGAIKQTKAFIIAKTAMMRLP